jgi:Skp family chaperone for outer membrane proteins
MKRTYQQGILGSFLSAVQAVQLGVAALALAGPLTSSVQAKDESVILFCNSQTISNNAPGFQKLRIEAQMQVSEIEKAMEPETKVLQKKAEEFQKKSNLAGAKANLSKEQQALQSEIEAFNKKRTQMVKDMEAKFQEKGKELGDNYKKAIAAVVKTYGKNVLAVLDAELGLYIPVGFDITESVLKVLQQMDEQGNSKSDPKANPKSKA